MDFRIVAEKLLKAFEKEGVRYALMGGFAMGLWAVPRTTVDMDFLIHHEDLEKLDTIMLGLGYERKYRSENVSQYISPLQIMGEVDVLHAFRKASVKMLDRAVEKKIFGSQLTIKVLKPEDVIGLKVQAMANDPSRQTTDLADIEALMAMHKDTLDWELIGEYFKIFNMQETANTLRKKYHEIH